MSSQHIVALAASSAGAPLAQHEFDVDVGADDVVIEVECCGVCASDLHLCRGHWGPMSVFPQVSGHEVIGHVVRTGANVNEFQPGQRVGVGWHAQSCGHCNDCENGLSNYCDEGGQTCAGGGKGGFANFHVAHRRAVFHIPEGLDSTTTAPLLCGGATVFDPLMNHSTADSTVGVVGVGGLGHIAIKFAHARGNKVVAISRNASKRELALSMGAHEYIAMDDADACAKARRSIDLLLVTISPSEVDWMSYLSLVAKRGTAAFLGASPAPISVSAMTLMGTGMRITSNPSAGRSSMIKMLEFAARHNLGATVETFDVKSNPDSANEALAKLEDGSIRFRGVLRFK